METLLALVVGVLFAAGVYLMLSRTPVKLVIGLALLSNAVNLLIFTAAGLTRGNPPLVPLDGVRPAGIFADPLPQALVLTAIVISFGLLAFTLVLFRRAYEELGTRNIDEMKEGSE
jgi:multicomponent Na+:H+ antiporter subunit C